MNIFGNCRREFRNQFSTYIFQAEGFDDYEYQDEPRKEIKKEIESVSLLAENNATQSISAHLEANSRTS